MATILIPLLVIMAVLFMAAGVFRQFAAESQMQQNVYESMGIRPKTAKSRGRLSENLDRRITKLSMAGKIEQRLIAADSKMTVAEYVLIRVGLGFAAFVIGWLISGNPLGGLLLGGLGSYIPVFQINRQINKRSLQIEEQLPDMLSLVTGSLQAGYGLLQACNVVQQEMPQPISTEFSRVIKETSLGISLPQALDHMVDRVKNDDMTMMVTAIHIQNEVGGSLAEVLETITATIRERIELRGEIRSMTAQQRMTGWILSLLPVGVGTLLMLMSPDYMMELFKPGWPMIIPISAVIMIIIGNIVMRFMMKIEV